MSTSDPNSSATEPVNPSLATTPETPATLADAVRTPPYQLLPAPSLPPPLYRPIAPFHHSNPFQQAHNNLYAQSTPNRRPNSPHQIHYQDPSAVLYPFTPPSRGFSSRPVRMSSPFIADSSITAVNQIGYPPLPVLAHNHGQFGPNQMESMMQFVRARSHQIHQFPHPKAGSPVRPGPLRGIPQFSQPRVAPPPSSILDTSRNNNARSQDAAFVLVRGRKVKITEEASLYSLCRSWLRNSAHEEIYSLCSTLKLQRTGTMKPLPKPLPVEMMEAPVPNNEEPTDEDKEDEESVKQLSEKDLLKRHVERAKKVRARLREERLRKISRYKARLALLLPESKEE